VGGKKKNEDTTFFLKKKKANVLKGNAMGEGKIPR